MYCKGKWRTADGKDPLFGHVDGFQIDPKIFKKDFRQHRTIRQEVSGRIFVPIQSSENGEILYVFTIFGTSEVEQKDG